MIFKSLIFLFACAIILASCGLKKIKSVQSQYVPISNRYPGLEFNPAGSLVNIELVYDVTCPDSVSFDQKWRDVVKALEQSHPGKFSYNYALHVLPFRIFSFKVTQAIRYTADNKGPEEGLKLLRHYFDQYKNWSQENILNTPISTLMDNLAKQTSTFTGLPLDEIRKQVAHFSVTDNATRRWVKYAMGTLHAGSAPTMLVNGARLSGFSSMSAQQLLDYLKALI